MSKTGRASRGIFALTATVLCFAAAYPGIIAAQANFSPSPLVLLRALIVTLALIGLAIAMQISMRISWRDLAVAGVLGQLGISGFQWLLYEAQQVSSAGTASTIVNMAPVITLIASALILKEQVSAKRWLGVLIAVVGVVVLRLSGATTDFSGVPLLIVAAVGLGLYSVFLKPLVLKYHPLSVTLHATWPGALVFAWSGPVLISEIKSAQLAAWLGVMVLALVVSAGGYVAWARAVQLLEVSKAAIVYYLVPPVAVLYTFILFGQQPLPLEYLGIVIVIFGVAVAMSKGKSND
ncbi:MAG: EamA family transporter [Actinomycetota bacterium]|nr:EamA family transporter [Actinomycetota bacterium]